MPRISGLDLIRMLREKGPPYSEMPLIALTAYVMREHRAAIDDAGADGVIAKPILSIEQFGDDILGFVRLRRGTTEAAPDPAHDLQNGAAATIDHQTFERLTSAFQGAARTELVSKVTADIGDAAERVEKALPGRDVSEICAATHVLISVAGAIGATKLQDLAQGLNSAGHAADVAVISRDGPELVAESERVLGFVRGA